MAKNYFKSYIWLLETLRTHGHLTLKELRNLWLGSSVNDEKKELTPRTFSNHVQSIADIFGIECDRRDNTYYISNECEIGGADIREWMLETLSLNSLLNESAGMKDRIIFENVPSSHKHLATVIQAMKDRKVLEVKYRSFRKDRDECLMLEPWCLREFKKRWYLFAHHEGIDGLHMYALDRILSATVGSGTFVLPKDFSAHEMFSGVYGVRHYGDMKCETVLLKADSMQSRYFRTLPLHSSQEEVETTADYSVFKYYLTPDYDFKQDVLSFGTSVEIIEPAHLRKEISEIVTKLCRKYNNIEYIYR